MTTELQERPITELLQWAKQFPAQTEQLAYDMTRLMQATEENINDVKGKPFFSRVLERITGSDKETQIETNQQLLDLQKLTQQRLLDLQQQNLLTAEAIIGVQNNLSTLVAKNEETQRQITLMAERVRERFLEMEERVGVLEVNSRIHSWLLTLETYDYDERYPTGLRTLKVIQDFIKIKGNEWNLQEIKFLQKGLKEAGLPWKEKLSTGKFIDMLVDEIESKGFKDFEQLLPLNTEEVSAKFVSDNISVATFSALYQIADKYQHSADTIEILQDSMDLSRAEAIRMVLRKFVKKQGVDLDIEIPLKDIAIEILSCTALSSQLSHAIEKTEKSNVVPESPIDRLKREFDNGNLDSGVTLLFTYSSELNYEQRQKIKSAILASNKPKLIHDVALHYQLKMKSNASALVYLKKLASLKVLSVEYEQALHFLGKDDSAYRTMILRAKAQACPYAHKIDI
ncbi:hypothetical protein L1D22_09055 [Vibrio sp. Isolate34]|uniref:hypothetical protein n=1 Tax=Vibrio sp. Isolate34 TaxID=2908540 RepID=UPI001EFEED80|nr:hypothetical protein [Vibrio sp. Isolate34]MCG9640050.1 hypothetical protein [Vibrio sp. Isolate34]